VSFYLAGRGWQIENKSNAGIFAGKWASSPRSGEIDFLQPGKRRLEAACRLEGGVTTAKTSSLFHPQTAWKAALPLEDLAASSTSQQ
jgi:hypothetical protein